MNLPIVWVMMGRHTDETFLRTERHSEIGNRDASPERDIVKGFPVHEEVPRRHIGHLPRPPCEPAQSNADNDARSASPRLELTVTQSDLTTSMAGAVSNAIFLAAIAMLRRSASSPSPELTPAVSFLALSSRASAACTRSKEGFVDGSITAILSAWVQYTSAKS